MTLITPDDMFPEAGCKNTIYWFRRHGLDWDDFRKNGIDSEKLRATGDHLDKIDQIEARAIKRITSGG